MNGFTLALAFALVAVALPLPHGGGGGGHPNNCNHWCIFDDAYLCCSKVPKCMPDNRPFGNCQQPSFSSARRGVSGPAKCSSNSSCHGRAICCLDKCLKYKVCKNV